MDPNINYAVTFVACFDEESNQKLNETLKLISKYRICKVPMKNDNRKDLDTLPFHSTISSWKIAEEQKIVEQIRRFFTFKSFTSDFKFKGKNTHICLEPIQEDPLRRLVTKAYNLKPREHYIPDNYHLHSTININPDHNQIYEQSQILKNITLTLRINEVRLYEIYPANLVCSVNENGFQLHKDIPLRLPPKITSSNQINIEQNEEKPFKGIINYLIDAVKVSSSSVCNDDLIINNPLNVINKKSPNHFSSKNEENSSIAFNFSEFRVNPTSYVIMSSDAKKNKSHVKSWVIEGSNDFINWDIIDENRDCKYLNDANATHKFTISNDSPKPYQFLRLRQIGPNCKGANYLKLKRIEFFGIIKKDIQNSPINQTIIQKDENKKFDGIINFLKENVKVSSSSVCNDDLVKYGHLNAIDRNSQFCFSSKNEENSWITFDFNDFRITPTCYEIMSSDAKKNKSHLKSWVIEGSTDKVGWNIIDENRDCDYLNDSNASYSINIFNDSGIPYQYIRLRQIAPNGRGENYLKFKQIEFYGYIYHI